MPLLIVIFIVIACGKKYPSPKGMDAEHGFQSVVLPVLYDQCEGCHFAGGVMYRDLPFDDQELVLTRGDELLTQLRGSGKERVAEWLALARQDTVSVKPGAGTPPNP